ncbi:MAG: hypothetical protein JWQ29_2960, partial [Phenylobacterium sp.]|nr:hypothetical protein [Phenylobacterium sp.]
TIPEWPPYNLITRPTMLLDEESRVVGDVEEPARKFWAAQPVN